MAYLARLRELRGELRGVVTDALATKAQLDQTSSAAAALHETARQVVDAQRQAQSTITETVSSMHGAAASAKSAAATISSHSHEAAAASRAAAADVEAQATRIAASAASAHNQVKTKLDELAYMVKDTGNVWNTQVAELIEAIKVGAAPAELLISQFGDALVQGQRLTEFLRGADLHVYQNQIRDLIQDLHSGNAAVADALVVLGQSQLSIAKGFKEVIELYQKGKVSLAFLLEQAEKIRRAMPDSDFAELAGAIEDALRRGDS